MTDDWEIVAGDFGGSYKATVKDIDLSACTAIITVWSNSTVLIKDDACGVVTYDSTEEESYLYYDLVENDIPRSAATDDIVRYNVMIQFAKAGFIEHTLRFVWIVHPPHPV